MARTLKSEWELKNKALESAQRSELFRRNRENPSQWRDVPGVAPPPEAQIQNQPNAPMAAQAGGGVAGLGAGVAPEQNQMQSRLAEIARQSSGVRQDDGSIKQFGTPAMAKEAAGLRELQRIDSILKAGEIRDRGLSEYLAATQGVEDRDATTKARSLELLGKERALNAPGVEDPSITVERMKQKGALIASPAFQTADKAAQDRMLAMLGVGKGGVNVSAATEDDIPQSRATITRAGATEPTVYDLASGTRQLGGAAGQEKLGLYEFAPPAISPPSPVTTPPSDPAKKLGGAQYRVMQDVEKPRWVGALQSLWGKTLGKELKVVRR